jgi:SAM-dependent methyltransferase
MRISDVIDKNKIKSFWDSRASTYKNLAFESIANLEQDPENLKLKIQLETEKVREYLGSVAGKSVLDLGAGVGQWAFRFIDGGALNVTAVEYSAPLVEIGRNEAKLRKVNNLEFVVSGAELFKAERTFDIVFISGLFVYMTDEQAQMLASNLPSFCHEGTIVLLRDGTAVGERYEINNRMSEHLQTYYSAIYRTRQGYIDLFKEHNFQLVRDENMFQEGCPLNKYPETRLRIYKFVQSA